MKKLRNIIFVVVLSLMAGCEKSDNIIAPSSSNDQARLAKTTQSAEAGQYIIVFNENVSRVPEVASEMAKLHAAEIGYVYQHSVKGFSAKMTRFEVENLRRDNRVKYVEDDKVITLSPIENEGIKGGKPPAPEPAQVTPWGITRVGGSGNSVGKTVWVIDTGVDLANKDLTIDVARSVNYVTRGKSSPNDGNGHGTHVAGTIAALDNLIDVVGVAAGATVVAVRVLDNGGSGYTSWVIAGVDYVAANGVNGDVANMSLGGGISQSLDDAVISASANVKFVVAAGNEGSFAGNYSPARVHKTNVYTVSAFASGDIWASWSNYGFPNPVDFSCPGVSILSLKKGGGTTTMSGTSMATPHLAGLLLLGGINTDGTVKDSQGVLEPIAHR